MLKKAPVTGLFLWTIHKKTGSVESAGLLCTWFHVLPPPSVEDFNMIVNA